MVAAEEAAGAPNRDGVGPGAAAELLGRLKDRGLPAQAQTIARRASTFLQQAL